MNNPDKDFKFEKDKILNLSSEIVFINILKVLENYNDEMTISQVVRFFERQGIFFTKTMIQNYIRIGLLPPPFEKRFYVKNHLILLSIIDSLKNVYSLEEIGKIFKPIINNTNTFNNIIDIGIIYKEYISLYENSINNWIKETPLLLDKISDRLSIGEFKNEDKDAISFFLTVLTLMTRSVVTKQLVKSIIDIHIPNDTEINRDKK